MNDNLCYSCSTSIPDKAIFCPVCAKQVRCKNCHELLEPNARACTRCGTLLGEGGKVEPTDVSNTQNVAPNRIEYKETLKMRSLTASFTNGVGSELTETLNLLLSNRIGVRSNESTVYVDGNSKQLLPGGNQDSIKGDELKDVIDSQFGMDKSRDKDSDNKEKLKQIFRYEDNQFKLIEPRIKATNKLDFARKLCFLFLFANEVENHLNVQRSELNIILSENNVMDSNIRTWISNSPDLEISGNIVKLKNPGREKAINILTDVFDHNITNSWLPGTQSRKRNGKRGNSTSDDNKDKNLNPIKNQKGETIINPSDNKVAHTSSGRPSPMKTIEDLISKGYFSERRTLGNIITYCQSSRALSYKNSDLTSPLTSCIHKGKLQREKNSDGQYVYFL
jgi:hypothetical protein